MKQNDLILVIDLQNVYRPGQPWGCETFARSLENVKALLDAADAADAAPLVYLTQFLANPKAAGAWADYNRVNRDINADPWMSELVPELAPYAKLYPVFQKSTYSSMWNPQVRMAAKRAGRVVLTGVVAECCVLATAMECIDMGCHMIWLTDGCSGEDLSTEAAVQKSLVGLSPLHITFMTTAEYLSEE